MPMTVTLTELLSRVRTRADMVGSDFVTDTELTYWINESIRSLYDMLVKAYGEDYFISSKSFNTVSGQSEYALDASPVSISDFYKLKGVDVVFSTDDVRTLRRFTFRDRNRYSPQATWTSGGAKAIVYRLQGGKLWLLPAPVGVYAVKVWYVPAFTALATGASTFDGINGWEKWVVAEVARKALMKEESDVSELNQELGAYKVEIEAMIAVRDVGEEEKATDVYQTDHDDRLPEEW